jgi:RHS repeat-associated protein
LTWNFADQLTVVKINNNGYNTYYNYDGGGQRVRKVIKNGPIKKVRLYLGGVECYRVYAGNTLKEETWTLQVDGIAQVDTKTVNNTSIVTNLAPLIRYQYSDHLGSATLETDENAAVISYEEYHPYGTTAYSTYVNGNYSTKRYRFTNKERDDETGLYYFGVRYYAAWLGRWTSSDPGGFVDGLNLYVYVRNNPINGVDELGYETDPPPDCPDCPMPEITEVGSTYNSKDGQTYELMQRGANEEWQVQQSFSLSVPSNLGNSSPSREPLSTIEIAPLSTESVLAAPVTQERIGLVRQRIEEPSEIEEISTGSFWGDLLLGEVPFVGSAVDGWNSIAAFSKGDILGGVINLISILPVAGIFAKGGKRLWDAAGPYVDDAIEWGKDIGGWLSPSPSVSIPGFGSVPLDQADEGMSNMSKHGDGGGGGKGPNKIGANAEKMKEKDLAEYFDDPNWHKKNSTKKATLKRYKKEMKGDTNADFYIDEGTKEILLKTNKSKHWIRTGMFFE